jgi:CHAT domain-containing protein
VKGKPKDLLLLTAMPSRNISITAKLALLACLCTPLPRNFPQLLTGLPARAENQETPKAQAGRLPTVPAFVSQADYSQLNYSQQIEYLEKQLQSARSSGDTQQQQEILQQLMFVAFQAREIPKAIEAGELLLQALRESKNRQKEAEVLQFMESLYRQINQFDKAITVSQQRLTIARELGDKNMAAEALEVLGVNYRQLKNYPPSIEALQQALQLAQESGNTQQEWNARSFLSLTYEIAGDFPKAAQQAEQNVAFARQHAELNIPPMSRHADSQRQLSRIYFQQGNSQQAIDTLKQIIALQPQHQYLAVDGQDLEDLGFMLLRAGNLKEAETTLLASIKNYDTAREQRLAALANLAQYGIRNQDSDIINEYEFGTDTPRLLQQVLVAQNRTESALEWAERGRARAFAARLAAHNSQSAAAIAPPDLAKIKQIAKAQNSTLVEYTVIYDDKWHYRARFGWDLDAPATALYIWVVKPTGEVTFRPVDLKPLFQEQNKSLADFVKSARDSINFPNRSAPLQQLHKILIEPIAGMLPADPSDRVTFIPQDTLFLVPFAALKDAAGKYLIEKHTILTAPSIQILELTRQLKQRGGGGQGALVVGNPTMPSIVAKLGEKPVQLESLPSAQQEALAIAELLNTRAITGASATKAAILPQMSKARIVHLATHGLLELNALALAPAGSDTGLLTAGEILDLKLSADLVVLSACNTGRGRITGDGVVGLSRAFVAAGAPSLVVSLWYVPDAPTALLMAEFYRQLQQKPDKARALRQAMLATMQKHPEPVNWAAFTLIGEAE